MSDAHRRYGAIRSALLQCSPTPSGHRAGHFATLVALICGLIGGTQAHLGTIASHTPANGASQESVITRFRRWLKDDQHTQDGWFLPVAQAVLRSLASQPLTMIMDGSVVGRGCLALMLSVVYHGRALPLAWVVVRGKKGHFPQETHVALLQQVQPLIPAGTPVTFLGDGEFDGTLLQAALAGWQWQYVCRTARNLLVFAFGVETTVGDLVPQQGETRALTEAWMTAERYGPVGLIVAWEAPHDDPLALVTNLPDLAAALARYGTRAHIETFFSDQKSRGFNLQRSHLSHPERLSRLLIAACLAYLWVVYLGVAVLERNDLRLIHRQDRCDLSLFRLGMRALGRWLTDHERIPKGLIPPATLPVPLRRRWREPRQANKVSVR